MARSYASCAKLAREHSENFPVASRLLPRPLRPHVAAIYAFARTADDVADEPGLEASERLALLESWRAHLHGRPGASLPKVGSAIPDPDLIFPAVHDTIARFDLPVSLFDDLLSAFEQDVTTQRYDTWTAVVDYCRRSANPVGRLVLRLTGQGRPELDDASDAVCTALQLVNFWQDLAIDWRRGRLYVPFEVYHAHAAETADLDRGTWSSAWGAALSDCGRFTRDLLARGRPVCDGVTGRLAYELRATWLGGMRILDRLEASRYDVFSSRPSLGPRDVLVIGWRALRWRRNAVP
jgi:squalene synthase HpnC